MCTLPLLIYDASLCVDAADNHSKQVSGDGRTRAENCTLAASVSARSAVAAEAGDNALVGCDGNRPYALFLQQLAIEDCYRPTPTGAELGCISCFPKLYSGGGTENARLENVAPNCRSGKREKRHVWKAKLRTPHVVVILV